MILRGLAVLIVALLAGCSSGVEQINVGQALKTLNAGRGAAKTNLRDEITPQSVAATGRPLILIELPGRGGAQALAFPLSENADTVTWISTDGVSLSLRRGVLSGTRGLGGDLMTADLDDVIQGVFAGQGRATRIHRYLDGEENTTLRAFVCDYTLARNSPLKTAVGTFSASLVKESCAGPDITVENRYWIGTDRKIRKSRQWVGPSIGYAEIEVLSHP